MTTEPATFNLQPATSASEPPTHSVPAPTSELPDTGAQVTSVDFKPRRKRGPQSKIAQLPGHQRMLINQLLDQDKTYEEIVDEMAKLGVQLNTDNVSKWYTGPYQEYLAALDWQDELHQLRDHAWSFTPDGDVRFQEAVVQIGLTQVFRDIKESRFKDDPANSLRLLNSLARLSREALVIRKYADQQAKEKVQELRKLDPNRKINDVENNAMHDRADDFFGWKSADRIKREMASLVSTDSTPSPVPAPVPVRTDSTPSLSYLGKSEPDWRGGLPRQSQAEAGDETLNNGQPGMSHALPALDSAPSADSKTETQPSTASPELCYSCGVPLPPLLPNGQRSSNICPGCSVRLYPPGTTFDHCPVCEDFAPILPGGERASAACLRCGQKLPPPGRCFLTRCPGCAVELKNITQDGQRIAERCPNCHTLLPLLEPIPDPNQKSKIETQKSDESPPSPPEH